MVNKQSSLKCIDQTRPCKARAVCVCVCVCALSEGMHSIICSVILPVLFCMGASVCVCWREREVEWSV